MLNAKESEIIFLNQLTEIESKSSEFLFIYDQALEKNQAINQVIQKFPNVYKVSGGEALKEIQNLPVHLEKILKILSGKEITLCGMGGGSVTDFTGFVASILKRGQPFCLLPTTWLSAVDSAHGGKNAMNIQSIKNQVGSFHYAEKIFLVKDLLLSEPQERFQEALSEIIKMKLISNLQIPIKLNQDDAYKFLPSLIEEKMKIVSQDPFDQKQIRAVLNFGHTSGHVFESLYKLSHGKAVALGLRFSLEWSLERKVINEVEYNKVLNELSVLSSRESLHLKPLSEDQVLNCLREDKKRADEDSLNFIFIKSIGSVYSEKIKLNDLIHEFHRQHWVE